MLLGFVITYLLISVGIGVWAATRVKNSSDFIVAGRHLPLPIVTATVFATWFGAETVLGISSTFVTDGLGGVAADPFGASLCLILAGVFYARKLYRMNLLTLADFFKLRFNRSVELICTICIIVSYLGWVSAQIKALGLVFSVVTNNGIAEHTGMIIGAFIVLTYTIMGGMMSVAILDFVQMTVIMAGLLFIGYEISGLTGGVLPVVEHAAQNGKFHFFPEGGLDSWVPFVGAGITLMLGSIPQQDVFQRITSAKNEKTAVRGSVLGGSLYFVFAFIPMFIAYSATLINPEIFNGILEKDPQLVLPTLIKTYTPLAAQVFFFGALISAIMSTSSATILAPSVTFVENILKGFFKNGLRDKLFMLYIRLSLLVFTVSVLIFALNSNDSIYEMVGNAYKITLSCVFVPLTFGLYWKKANSQGALLAIFGGGIAWILMEIFYPEGNELGCYWPPQVIGLAFSFVFMIIGSLLPEWIGKNQGQDAQTLIDNAQKALETPPSHD